MDLRRKLVVRLALAFLLLGLAFATSLVVTLRADARTEQTATFLLAELLLAPRTSDTLDRVRDAAAAGRLRHVEARWRDEDRIDPERRGWIERLLPPPAETAVAFTLTADGRTLVLRTDPSSEFREQVGDAMRTLLLIGSFALLALILVWVAADRALSPVVKLESALRSLQGDPAGAHAPHFQLREFESVARTIDQVSTTLAQAREAQRRLTRTLLDVQDRERRKLAADLHDEVGQSLTAISVCAAYIRQHAGRAPTASIVECATEIAEEARRMASQVRGILTTLRPYDIARGGLSDTLADLVASWQSRLVDVELEARIGELPPIADEAAVATYRSLQELLTNAVRHSRGRSIRVSCREASGAIVLNVSDDGVGRTEHLRTGDGTGLAGLRERLAMVGGDLSVDGVPGGGLSFTARIPAGSGGAAPATRSHA